MNRIAKKATIGIVGFFSALAALWWFGIGQERYEFNRSYAWVREIGASVLGGHGILSGVDFADVKPDRFSPGDLWRLSGLRDLQHLRLGRRKNGDEFVAAMARLPNRKLSSFAFFDVGLTSDSFATLSKLGADRCKERHFSLTFWQTPVSPDGLRNFRSLQCTLSFAFIEAELGEAHFEAIAANGRTASLRLQRMARLSREAFVQMSRMPLDTLALYDVPVGDEIGGLAGAKRLRWLSIYHREFDDEGGRHLVSLPSLSDVHLSRTRIGDATMAALGTLPSLRSVNIANTRVTDEGLVLLATAQNLRWVVADGTAITPAGVARAQTRRPELKVRLQKP